MRSSASLISSETMSATVHPQGRNTLASPTFTESMRMPATEKYCPIFSGNPSSGVQYCTSPDRTLNADWCTVGPDGTRLTVLGSLDRDVVASRLAAGGTVDEITVPTHPVPALLATPPVGPQSSSGVATGQLHQPERHFAGLMVDRRFRQLAGLDTDIGFHHRVAVAERVHVEADAAHDRMKEAMRAGAQLYVVKGTIGWAALVESVQLLLGGKSNPTE